MRSRKVLVPAALIVVFGSPPRYSWAQDIAVVRAKIDEWERIVARDPSDYETLTSIGAAYGKLGENATAVRYFQKAIAANPNFAPAHLGLGTAYGFLKQATEALAALTKAVALDPADPIGRAKLGTALGRAHRYAESIPHLKEAIRLKPDLAEAHFALGLAYLSLGNRSLAVQERDALTAVDPSLAARLSSLIAQAP